MAEQTDISWSDATFNPWIGCTKVGDGCLWCYAEEMMDHRYHRVQWGPGKPRVRTSASNWNLPKRWNARPFYECPHCKTRGEVHNPTGASRDEVGFVCTRCFAVDTLKLARRRVFCSSLADVFDNEVDPAWRADLFRLIRATPHLDWLLLTKRVGNVPRMVTDAHMAIGTPAGDSWDTLPSNAWLGATLVNREEMLRDGPKLKDTAARVRFWSCEPLLEDVGQIPVDLLPDWVIVGGESGRGARDFSIDAARSIVEQCQRAGVPVHVKQMGAQPVEADDNGGKRKVIFVAKAGRDVNQWPADLQVQEFPKV